MHNVSGTGRLGTISLILMAVSALTAPAQAQAYLADPGPTVTRTQRSPRPAPAPARPTIVYLTPATVQHPMNVYRELSLPADPLFGRSLRVRGYTLDGLLRRTAGDTAALAEQGYRLTLRTRSGQTVRVPLSEVLGRGAVLAYAEVGAQEWPLLPQGKGGSLRSIYLVWPGQPPRPELAGLWDLTRLTLSR